MTFLNFNNISDFFNKKSYATDNVSRKQNVQSGYEAGALRILVKKSQILERVKEEKVHDWINVEKDPNFSKFNPNIRDKFESILSELSFATSIVTIFNSKLSLANLDQFLPENLRNLLFNFNSLVNTNINKILNAEQFVPFDQIEEALFSDLKFNFLGKTLNFTDIATFSANFIDRFPTKESLKNNGLRSLLSLNIQSLLPNSFLDVFNLAQYFAILNDVFVRDESERIALDNRIRSRMKTLSNKKVENVISNEYDDTLSLKDPMGLIVQDAVRTDLIKSYNEEIRNTLEEEFKSVNISDSQKEELILLFQTDATDKINTSLKNKSLGTPKLERVSRGVKVNTYNETVRALKKGFDRYFLFIIDELQLVKRPSDDNFSDYLFNMKKNIRLREQYKSRSATIENNENLDKYFRTILKNDNDISEKTLDELEARLNNLLGDD